MPVLLPDMSHARCDYLWTCGEIQQVTPPNLPTAFASDGWHTARYELSGTGVLIGVGWHFHKSDGTRHLHFNFVKEDWFKQRRHKSPKVNIETKDVEQLINSVRGEKYDCAVGGKFILAADKLPFMIRVLTDTSKVASGSSDGVDIQLTSGTLSVKGLPLKEIAWEKDANSDNYVLTLEAKGPALIDSELADTALQFIESVFSALRREQSNGQ